MFISIDTTNACGVDNPSLPTISLKTATVRFGGTDGLIKGRILTHSGWTTWRNLDNIQCDDYEQGNTDYYDTFNDIK